MSILKFERLGIILETFFVQPVPFSDTLVQELAFKALGKFRRFGLTPTAISSTPGDRLFGYIFSFSLGKSVFRMNAEKIEINCLDATSPSEASAMWQFVTEAAGLANFLKKEDTSTFQIYAHAAFKSEGDKEAFLKSVPLADGVKLGGLIAYSVPENWNREIRFQVDRSTLVQGGLFILLGTSIQDLITADILTKVYKNFEEFTSRMGIQIEATNG
jgi:hypothetical protein